MHSSNRFEVFAGLAMIGQLGMNLVLPPVLLTLLAVWFNSIRYIGTWLPIVALSVGIVIGILSLYRTLRAWLYRNQESDSAPTNDKEISNED